MPQRDGKSEKQVVHLGNLTLSGTGSTASAWVDTTGFDCVTLMAVSNTITDAGTASGYSFVVQEADDTAASSAAAVDDDELVGLESDLTETTDGNDNTIAGLIGYIGGKRYVRLQATGTTGSDADVSVIAICEKAHIQPPTTVGSSVAAT